MKQILTLTVTAMQEKLYIAYMLFVLNLIDELNVIGEKFEYYVNQFRAAYNHLNLVYLKYDVKFFTEKVQAADKDRAQAYRDLRARIRYLATYAARGEVKEAARILLEIITLYGDAVKMKMNERTTVITNLIEDYGDKYQTQVATTEVGELVTALRDAQEQYLDAFMKRNEADSQYALNAMADARKVMTEAYRDLVDIVNLAAKRDEEGVLDEFINRLNNEIRRNFIHTGQRPASAGGGTADGGTEGSDTEGGPSPKAVTFIFNNGTELKLWFLPGDPIEVPANNKGYRWNPEVPEFMPKRGKTFREVPIEDREAVATFHFADHTEEEVRQIVGTALTAPENTPGYYWDPEVPETMPEEDTQYYELPEEEEEQQPTLYTVRFMKGSELVAEQQYEAGAVIQAPAAPSGYEWEDYPYRMPAEDITVNAVRRNIPGGGGGSGFE